MKKLVLLAAATLTLAACGTQTGDRIASGAAIGAGTGAVLGPVGAGAGALAGGVAGAVTPAEEVNLGDPVWNDPDFPDQDQPANPK
jgi:hypothetical protein